MTPTIYRTRRPAEALRSHVARYWAYDGYTPAHAEERVLPTGTLELVAAPAGERLAWRELTGRRGTYAGAILCGPRVTAFDVPTGQQRCLVGVHFRPGGAWPILGVSMEDLVDALVPLAAVFGREADVLGDALAGHGHADAWFDALDRFLLARQKGGRSPHHAVQFALRCLANGRTQPIQVICRDTGLSHRRLVELFRRQVGPTPREFARLRRLHRALRAAGAAPPGDLADAAVQAGFSDQAHWGRECRKLLQMTPASLVAAAHRANDVPVGERGQMVPID